MKRPLILLLGVVALMLPVLVGRPPIALGQTSSFRLLSSFYVLVGDTIYHLDPGNPPIGWRALPYGNFDAPPIPASTLLALESGTAITDSGEGWIRTASGWQSVGQIPGTVATMRSSSGAVKARYR